MNWDAYTRSFDGHTENVWVDSNSVMRHDKDHILQGFVQKSTRVLDVPCAFQEPFTLQCNRENTVAIDLSRYALSILVNSGFKGDAIMASSTALPLRTESFDLAVCSELIEHLNTDNVKATLGELNRVAEHVVVTTPNCYLHAKILDPTHVNFFTARNLQPLIPSSWKVFTSHTPQDDLNTYLQFKSPRFMNKQFAKAIYSLIDKFWAFPVTRKLSFALAKGAYLLLVK